MSDPPADDFSAQDDPAGDDKSKADCVNRFSNIVNFRGVPTMGSSLDEEDKANLALIMANAWSPHGKRFQHPMLRVVEAIIAAGWEILRPVSIAAYELDGGHATPLYPDAAPLIDQHIGRRLHEQDIPGYIAADPAPRYQALFEHRWDGPPDRRGYISFPTCSICGLAQGDAPSMCAGHPAGPRLAYTFDDHHPLTDAPCKILPDGGIPATDSAPVNPRGLLESGQ